MVEEREIGGRHVGALSRAMAGYRRITDILASVLLWSLIVALVIVLGCIALQVFLRYFFGAPPSWAEEVAMLAFSWSATGALALGLREGFHVRIELISFMPGPLRGIWERFLNLLIACFGLFLLWAGWRFVELTAGGKSAAARYPIELLHVMAPISGFLVLVFALERVFGDSPPAKESHTDAGIAP